MFLRTIRPWIGHSTVYTKPSGDLEAVLAMQLDSHHFPQPPAPVYMSQCSHTGYNSNQRTRNQFRPRNATKGTSSYQLRQYAEATLGGGSLRKIVKLPEGEDENEWLAVNSKSRRIHRQT